MSVSQDINLASISQSVSSLSNEVIRLTMDDTLNDGDGSEFEFVGSMWICWQHVKRRILENYRSIKDNKKNPFKEELLADIYELQRSKSRKLFEIAVDLFVKKWDKEEAIKTFLSYLKKQWLGLSGLERTNWYQGYIDWVPDHNNNNEADNRWIKEGRTHIIKDWLYTIFKLFLKCYL